MDEIPKSIEVLREQLHRAPGAPEKAVNDAEINPVERLAAFHEEQARVAEHLRLDARDASIREQRGTEMYLLLWSIRAELRAIRALLEVRS